MIQNDIWNNESIVKVLNNGGIVVMPTDTLYGIVGIALNEFVVNRIYAIRKRNPDKPCIILIGEISELEKFSIHLSEQQKNIFEKYTEPTSIVLDCGDDKFEYLHRGTKTLAFRIPNNKNLQNLLLQTGPLTAPSANTEALPPSTNIDEAKKYFGDLVDLYIDGGEIAGKASKIIQLHKDGTTSILRV